MDFSKRKSAKLSAEDKLSLIIAGTIGIGIATGIGAALYFVSKKEKNSIIREKNYIKINPDNPNDEFCECDIDDTLQMEDEKEVCFSHAEETKLSFEQAYAIAKDAAREQFGENAFVVPASEKQALYVNIGGVKRACFMFGADKMDLIDSSMKGLYHVDANTGEVFDNGEGKMSQLK